MALLSVNAADGAEGHAPARDGTLPAALAALPLGQPVTILIHGYRFCPHEAEHDPHRHILSLEPRRDCWKAVSWPRHLHLDRTGRGLGIGFGWPATGRLRDVAARATEAGRCLARMIAVIRRLRRDVPVQIVAHSLGARVALSALEHGPDAAVSRIILIAGAEYRTAAARAMASPAARHCAVLNVTSAENTAFDVMFRLAVGPDTLLDLPLSHGLDRLPGCIDLAIDRPATRDALRPLGHRIKPPATAICHWSGYMRPGLFAVYRRFLDPAEPGFASRLAAALAAQRAGARGEQRPRFPRGLRAPAIASWTGRSQV